MLIKYWNCIMSKFNKFFMDVAIRSAELSWCKKRKVGSVITKNNTIISVGYNGQPAGGSNCCEDDYGVTKYDTVHAEDNALRHLMKSHESSIGATLYVTLEPCERCASMIIQSGIKKVFYHEIYTGSNSKNGNNLLIANGVEIIKL